MKKSWEETWERHGLVVAATNDETHPARFGSGVDAFSPKDKVDREIAALDLAACAPEMARLLLEAEWANMEHIHGGGVSECPWCTESRNEYGKHRNGCPWLALMKKAGVR